MKATLDHEAIIVRYLEDAAPEELRLLLDSNPAATRRLLDFALLEQLCREVPIAPGEATGRRRVRGSFLWKSTAAAAAAILIAGLIWFNRPGGEASPGKTADAGDVAPPPLEMFAVHSLPWVPEESPNLPDFSLVSLTGPARSAFPTIHEISLYADYFPRDSILTITPFL